MSSIEQVINGEEMTTFTRPVPKPTRKKQMIEREPRVVVEQNPLEDSIQIAVVQWLRINNIKFFHPANGGYRHKVTANRMKAQGVVAGVPDLIITTRPPFLINGKQYIGCCVELKRKGGVLSHFQSEWLAHFKEMGWAVNVCYSVEETIDYLQSLGYGVRR